MLEFVMPKRSRYVRKLNFWKWAWRSLKSVDPEPVVQVALTVIAFWAAVAAFFGIMSQFREHL